MISLKEAEGRKPMFSSLIFAVVLHVASVQIDSIPDLYALEDDPSGREVIWVCNLVRVSMDRENKLVRETLVSTDQRFFGTDRRARIAMGRFIVAEHGGVVDIKSRKVIHEDLGPKVLGVEDRKVVYRRDWLRWIVEGSSASSELFSFDLNARKRANIPQGSHWDPPGVKSPDRSMIVVARSGVITLNRLGKAPEVFE